MQDWDNIRNLNEEEFFKRFSTQEQCLEFLAQLKWRDGYVCRKCGHIHYCKGKKPSSRRCTRCKHDESATAHTIFHRCKIHLPEAFRILHIACHEPGISIHNISDRLQMRLMTCWRFRKKVMECLDDPEGFRLFERMGTRTRDEGY